MFLFLIVKCILLHRELIKQKEYFVDTLSHDLRVSAIAQIRGLDLLQKSDFSLEEKRDLIADINNSCKFSLNMISMLIKTFRYEAGEQIFKYENFALNDILRLSCQEHESMAREKEVTLDYKIEGLSLINADKAEIHKVFSFLVSTAITNAKRKTNIEIAILLKKDKYLTEIKYNGIALTEQEKRIMFSKKRRYSTVGHGIKMHLCKKIIEFHKGKIAVDEIVKGCTVFRFVIPKNTQQSVSKMFFISTCLPNKL
jgi:K+-sensing histidine kinase KdpD